MIKADPVETAESNDLFRNGKIIVSAGSRLDESMNSSEQRDYLVH